MKKIDYFQSTRGILFWLLPSAIVLWTPARAAELPKPQGRVNDFAGVLSVEAKEQCATIISDVEKVTGDEVAVVTISSLENETVEEYAVKLFKAWGIGKKGKDNGVLLLVAVQDHKMRIEVGYGLEPILPDGLAGDIIRQELRPAFKRGDFSGGVQEGLARIADILKKAEPVSEKDLRRMARPDDGLEDLSLLARIGVLLFFACFVGIGFFMVGAGLGSKVGFFVLFGSFFGGLPCLMSLAFPVPHVILPVFGLALLAVGFQKGRSSPQSFRNQGKGSGSSGSGWMMGGSSGGGSSSSSESDFGGGSSGGGGASGDW